MKIGKLLFYLLLFLFVFGRFLPAYNPPVFVTEFFGSATLFFCGAFISFCLLSWRILKNLALSSSNRGGNKKLLFNSVAVLILCAAFVALVPVLQNLQNKFVVWMNRDRDAANLINPTLGMTMYRFPADEDDERLVEEVIFVSFGLAYNGNLYKLIYTPSGIEKSRWSEDDDGSGETYNNQWKWIRFDKRLFTKSQNTENGNFIIY